MCEIDVAILPSFSVAIACFWLFDISPVNVYVPKDRVTNLHQGYGFVEFRSEEDADYVSVLHSCSNAFTL